MEFFFTRLKSFLKVTSIHNPGNLLQNTEKKLAYPECCKQAQNIGKPLKNLDIYSPLLHSKTNWTPCRDTSHLRAEHLLHFTLYNSTVYISQNPSYHEPWAHKFAIRRANIFLFRTQLLYNMGHMDMGLSPEDGASIPQSLTDGFGLFVGHMTALHLPPSPALHYF